MTSHDSPSTRNRRPITMLLVVQLLNGMAVAAKMNFFLIYITDELGFATVVAAGLVSLGQVAGIIASVLGGSLNDALGRKWTLVAGLGCFVIGGLAFFARSPWIIGVLWFVNGTAMTLGSLGAQGYLIAATSGASLGVISALYHWGFTLGGALGSPVAGYVLDSGGYSSFAPLVAGLAAVTFVLAILLMPRLGNSQAQQHVPWTKTLAGYLSVVRQPTVIRLGLLRFLPTCYYGMAVVLIPLLIHAETGTKSSVAAYATANLILATLSQLVAGRTADRVGARIPMLAALGGVVVAALGLTLFAGELWGLYVFGILGGAAAWSLSTLMLVLVSGSTSPDQQGRVLGALILLWNVAMIISAMIGGALVEVSAGLPFAIAVVLNLGAIAIAVSFFRSEGAVTL
jgi:MFS transporter, DHA1 family, inner membrane transport protein